MHIVSAETVTGNSVENPKGEHLGEIKSIMLDLEHGRIAYAVLDFGGFLGLQNKYFAVPWQGFVINTAREKFIIDIPREKLEQAEGFDQDNWPDMANMEWAADLYKFYGYEPYWVVVDRDRI